MAFIKDQALIITKKPCREQDALVTILTRQHGRLTTVAIGLSKIDSRLLGAVQPGAIGQCALAMRPGKVIGHHIVRLVSFLPSQITTQSFADHPYLLLWAWRFIGRFPLPEVPDQLWKLIINLESTLRAEPRGFQVWWALRVLSELGLAPNLDTCHQCGQKLQIGVRHHQGRLYCSTCAKPAQTPVSLSDLKKIQVIINSSEPSFPYPPLVRLLITHILQTSQLMDSRNFVSCSQTLTSQDSRIKSPKLHQ